MHLIVDCATGEARYVPPSPEEEAAKVALQVEGAKLAEVVEARAADRSAALEELKTKAATDPDLALVARVLGVDIAQPQPPLS